MKTKVIACCLLVAAGFTSTACFGQTKFLTWLRQRIGATEATTAQQEKDNADWRKEHFADAAAQEKFIAAVKKVRCDTCHVKGKGKKIRNPFGTELSKFLQQELKMNSKEITAALRSSAPEETRQKVEQTLYDCLDKALNAKIEPDNKDSKTFGHRVKQGELPAGS